MPETAARPDPTRAPAPASWAVGPYLVFLLLIAATIPWRSKAYYEGGADSVVVAKAVLSLLALAAALLMAPARRRRPARAFPLLFLFAYLACSVIGGWAAADLVPSVVIAVRVALLAVTVVVLASAFRTEVVLGALVAALATCAGLAATTGLAGLSDGRLRGVFPPLHPNELASMAAIAALWCLWKVAGGRDAWFHLLGGALAVAVVVATGSRTPLVALPIGAAVILLRVTAVRLRTAVLAVLVMPVLVWVLAGTAALNSLLLRGGSAEGLTTLSNRTIAWEAALSPKDSAWSEWFGGGLVLKRIEVSGQWWNEQILDSSWISALVQSGLVGLALCVVWLLYSLVATLDSSPALRTLQLALLLYLASRGLLESGLFDASPSFLLLFTVVATIPVRAAGAQPPELDRVAGSTAESSSGRVSTVSDLLPEGT